MFQLDAEPSGRFRGELQRSPVRIHRGIVPRKSCGVRKHFSRETECCGTELPARGIADGSFQDAIGASPMQNMPCCVTCKSVMRLQRSLSYRGQTFFRGRRSEEAKQDCHEMLRCPDVCDIKMRKYQKIP